MAERTAGRTAAIVLAAGQGKRMKSSVQKQFMELAGKPLIVYALQRFEESEIDEIILVTGEESVSYCREKIVEAFHFQKVTDVVAGGKERYHSVYAGLKALDGRGISHVLIHDGARPLVTAEIIDEAILQASACGAAAPAVPVKETVKLASGGRVEHTPDRSALFVVQTPQVFDAKLIKKAYAMLMEQKVITVTDDAMVAEQMPGITVRLFFGSYENIKITTPEDLDIAEVFLKRKS